MASVRVRLRYTGAAAVVGLALVTSAATAQQRPDTRGLTCSAVKALVARRGDLVLLTSPTAYEMVHLDSGACQGEVTSAPAFVPSLDEADCFAGYRCRQRNNEGSGAK